MNTCGKCRYFINPESKYERNSIGECSYYSAWVAKWNGKIIPRQADDRAQKILGDRIFMTDVERNCQKYIDK